MTARASVGRAGACALAGLAWTACSGGTRDTLIASQDVIVDGGPGARSPEGYDYVARRPLAVVALAEARGLPADVARAAIDHLADTLDACVTERSRGGAAPSGAARVVAEVGPDGAITGANLRVDPGGSGPAIPLMCLVAPVKLLAFPLADAGVRGFAIEALWGAPSAPAQP
jgi:hypothetical protein